MLKIIKNFKDRVLVSMLSKEFLAEYGRVETMKEQLARKLNAAQQRYVDRLDDLDDSTLKHLAKLPPEAGQLGVMIITDYASRLCPFSVAQGIQHMLYALVPNPTPEERRATEGIMTSFIAAQKRGPSVHNLFQAGSNNLLLQGTIDNPTFNTENPDSDEREQ